MSRSALVLPVLTAGLLVLPSPAAAASTTAATLRPDDTVVAVRWSAISGADAYRVTRDGVIVATVPASATSWLDTGLTNGTAYRYQVSGLSGGASSVVATATTTPLDLRPPSLEGSVALRILDGGLMVYWRASGDVTDAAQYRLSVNGEVAGVSTSASTSGTFSVTGLTREAQDLVLEAVDRAGNATRLWHGRAGADDVEPPAAPLRLRVDACTSDSATLSWDAMSGGASGDLAVSYRIRKDGWPVATTTQSTGKVTGLTAGLPAEFTVSAVDAAGNSSPETYAVTVTPLHTPSATSKALSATANCTVSTPDTLPAPPAPTLSLPRDGEVGEIERHAAVAHVRIDQDDARRYAGYRLYVDDRLVRTGAAGPVSSYLAIPLQDAGTRPRISVETVDLFGSASPRVSITTHVLDGTAPAVPTGLSASVDADRLTTVAWAPAGRATSYQVEIDGRAQPLTSATSLTLPPTDGAQVRTVRVTAHDAHGRTSLPTPPLFVTT